MVENLKSGTNPYQSPTSMDGTTGLFDCISQYFGDYFQGRRELANMRVIDTLVREEIDGCLIRLEQAYAKKITTATQESQRISVLNKDYGDLFTVGKVAYSALSTTIFRDIPLSNIDCAKELIEDRTNIVIKSSFVYKPYIDRVK